MMVADYLDVLRDEGRAFADTCEGNLDAEVPSCPGWTVAELVWHLGHVHTFWRVVVGQRLQDVSSYVEPDRPADGQLLPWYRDSLFSLHAVLTDADPDEAVWTWSDRRNVGFVQRRVAHETAVHRWDAEAAAGRDHSIDAGLARDGIDEFFDCVNSRRARGEPVGGTVHLHAADADVAGEGEWFVEESDRGFTVTHAHAKGDAALRGTSSELLLALWGRRPPAELQVLGDARVLQRFLARACLG